MTLTEHVERFSKCLALFRPGDEEAARELRGAFDTSCGFAEESESFALRETHARIGALLDALLADAADELSFAELCRLLDWLQDAALQIDDGGDPEALASPFADPPAAEPTRASRDSGDEPIDQELLGLFVASCETTLSDLEGEVLGAEKAEDPGESIAGIRRTIHTFKGECGVLSLTVAQELCHRMETAIDLSLEGGRRVPVDLILDLVDWLRSYVELLRQDNLAAPPDSTALNAAVIAFLQDLTVAPESLDAPASTQKDPEPESTVEPDDDEEPVSFEIDEDYLENLPEFLSEAQSHLVDAEAAILEFDKDGRSDFDLIDRTFRAFHTIKGVAGFLNLTPIVELAHTAETLLDGLRKQSFRCTTRMIDLILQSCDSLARLVDVLQGQAQMSRAELARLIRALEEVTSHPDGAAEAPGALSAQTEAVFEDIAPQAKLEPAAPVQDSAPTSGMPNPLPSSSPAESEEAPRAAAPAAASSVPAMDESKKSAKRKALTKKLDSTITVSTTRLDSLVDLVGELVIAQSMVTQDPEILELTNQKLSRNLSQVNKITRDLQEGAMSLRMVTLKSTFQKMARLVRDVSAKAKKQVDFVISGEDTELDRNVVEEISDPLVHMIRNAIDHGIEAPDERTTSGKPPEGILQLKAYHQGGSIVIEISDDGRGLAKDKILKKAIERGIVPPGTPADALSDSEIYGLVFQAGFSTAEKVTDISGRGVGMDVVKRNIEALRGKVEIESRPGRGTTFKMMLPLTLAIIDGMIVRVGSQRYVIPTLAIVQSFQPTAGQTTRIFDKGETVKVREEMLPVRKLREIFALDEGESDPTKGLLIVVEDNANRSCLLVDEILGQQQVVIKNLGKATGNIPGVSGGAILGDGRIALILDISGLFDEAAAKRA